MPYLFTTPVVRLPFVPAGTPMRGANRLWAKTHYSEGVTVLRLADGSFVQRPGGYDSDEAKTAAAVYAGGRTYTVSDTEGAALSAAGYTVVPA